MKLLLVAVLGFVALAYAEPEPEAWGGNRYGGYGGYGGYRGFGGYRGGSRGFGGVYFGRKKRSADPEPVAEPAAEPEAWGGYRYGGYGGYGGYRGFGGYRGGSRGFGGVYFGRKKRSADPEPVAEPAAEPEAWGGYRYGGYGGYGGYRGFGGYRGYSRGFGGVYYGR